MCSGFPSFPTESVHFAVRIRLEPVSAGCASCFAAAQTAHDNGTPVERFESGILENKTRFSTSVSVSSGGKAREDSFDAHLLSLRSQRKVRDRNPLSA